MRREQWLHFLTVAVALLSSVSSARAQAPIASLVFDLDDAEGNQGLRLLQAVAAQQMVPVQIFGTELDSLTGYGLRIMFDPSSVSFVDFVGIPGNLSLPLAGETPLPVAEVVEAASIGPPISGDLVLLGTLRFKTSVDFGGGSRAAIEAFALIIVSDEAPAGADQDPSVFSGASVLLDGEMPSSTTTTLSLPRHIPVTDGLRGQRDKAIPISISNAAGILSVNLTFTFDAAYLNPTQVELTEETDGFYLSSDLSQSGRVALTLTGYVPLARSGIFELVRVLCDVPALEGDTEVTTDLRFQSVQLSDGDGTPLPDVELRHGRFIWMPGIRGDVDRDAAVTAGDAIRALRYDTGLEVPSTYQRWAADVDRSGYVTVGDAIRILRKAVGLDPLMKSATTIGRPVVSLVSLPGARHGEARVQLRMTGGEGVLGSRLVFQYDPSMAAFGQLTTGASVLQVANSLQPGLVVVSLVGLDGIADEDGTVAELTFRGEPGSILKDLILRDARLFDGAGQEVSSTLAADGRVGGALLPAPTAYALSQNYPNPFNPATEIRYAVVRAGDVTLAVFDGAGHQVRMLTAGRQEAGAHTLTWDGTNDRGHLVASGVYVYRLTVGSFTAVRKMMLMR